MGETGALADSIELLRAALPTVRVERYALLGEGWDSVALLVNDQDVFRCAKRPDVAVRQAREAELLPLLADRLPLPVPRYTHAWADPAWPGTRIVGYPLIRGEQLMRARAEQHAAQAAELGAFVRALHAVPVAEARRHGALDSDAASRRAAYRRFFATVRENMLPLFTEQEQAAIVAFWSRYLEDDACFAFTPALVHRDLNTEHVLFDPATGRLTGVIDWGDAAIDDPAVDFAGLRRELGDEFARQMLAAYRYPVDPTFFHRMDFYAGMEPFHEIHFGQSQGDAAHLAHGIEWARRNIGARPW
ncbi:MAG TPA: phosphotransferase [Ktedonobacterales bacterium]|nr:phosphotransferase [Ktedonobacterales bacterium]